jgi:hypothetical protein
MPKADNREYSHKGNEASSFLDQTILDEFFSTIASIAVRLTKDDDRDNNVDDSTSLEVSKK